MLIQGFQKTTLLDYPGKVSAVIFTYGCNFRCEYCHNPELVIEKLKKEALISEDVIFDYLKSRKGKLDALAITGGEPTLQKDLIPFIKKVKALGYLVKLDTNGSDINVLKKLYKQKLVDYVAMDVKFPKEWYSYMKNNSVGDSISLIMNSGIDYEFRTTVVKGMHTKESIEEICKMIEGSSNYTIQNFRPGKTINPSLDSSNSFTLKELKVFEKIAKRYIKKVYLRY